MPRLKSQEGSVYIVAYSNTSLKLALFATKLRKYRKISSLQAKIARIPIFLCFFLSTKNSDEISFIQCIYQKTRLLKHGWAQVIMWSREIITLLTPNKHQPTNIRWQCCLLLVFDASGPNNILFYLFGLRCCCCCCCWCWCCVWRVSCTAATSVRTASSWPSKLSAFFKQLGFRSNPSGSSLGSCLA